MKTKALFVVATFVLGSAALVRADVSTGEASRLREASTVIRELRDLPDKGIPDDLWAKAQCVVVIPSMKKAALGLGGEYGRGVMSCRRGADWSAPIFMTLAKGSWGLQIGFAETDLVMLVMNERGVDKLLSNKVSLGADASVAAGPVGRTGAAATDAQFSAEILSYSRARGVFAGIDLSGGVLRPDDDANADVYGKNFNPKSINSGAAVPVPTEARAFVQSLSVAATTGKK
ncbi:MAG TPA: lipid-binding SYLF domain-containing protein [Vicinamibacterales bacterium]|nr:lipid-binding SYLF domain-containing protein [Vicinamibacterales bacterium]